MSELMVNKGNGGIIPVQRLDVYDSNSYAIGYDRVGSIYSGELLILWEWNVGGNDKCWIKFKNSGGGISNGWVYKSQVVDYFAYFSYYKLGTTWILKNGNLKEMRTQTMRRSEQIYKKNYISWNHWGTVASGMPIAYDYYSVDCLPKESGGDIDFYKRVEAVQRSSDRAWIRLPEDDTGAYYVGVGIMYSSDYEYCSIRSSFTPFI